VNVESDRIIIHILAPDCTARRALGFSQRRRVSMAATMINSAPSRRMKPRKIQESASVAEASGQTVHAIGSKFFPRPGNIAA
jgi:hypothetical protein